MDEESDAGRKGMRIHIFRRRTSRLLIALIVVGILFSIMNLEPTFSTFSDSKSVHANFGAGTWSVPTVSRVCPCYGVSGMCAWAVFLYGSNLASVSEVKLVKGSTTVSAKKVWHIGDGVLYCVFDLRKSPTGSYNVVTRNAAGQETVVYKGFKIISVAGCGAGAISAAAQTTPTTTTAEDPLGFKLTVKNDDPTSLVASVQGPVRSKFLSASLVANGTRVDGIVDSITKSGCRVKFARAGLPLGTYDLNINRGDDSSLLMENSFVAPQYVSPMKVMGVQPASGLLGQKVQLKVTGVRLDLANGIALVQGSRVIQPAAPVKASASQLTVTFNLTGVPLGVYDLSVSCTDGTQSVLHGCFTVGQRQATDVTQPAEPTAPNAATAPAPPIPDVTPRSCFSGRKVTFTISGNGLRSDMKIKLVGVAWWGWPLTITLRPDSQLDCVFDLTGAPAGLYQIVIVAPDGSQQAFEKPIEVLPVARQMSSSR